MANIREFPIPNPYMDFEGRSNLLVTFTDDLNSKADFDQLCDLSRMVSYIAVGIVRPQQDPQFYFGNSRKHAELKMAIESEIGAVDDEQWSYGQMVLGLTAPAKVFNLDLHQLPDLDDKATQRLVKGLFSKINHEVLPSRLPVGIDGSLQYLYHPDLRRVTPYQSRISR